VIFTGILMNLKNKNYQLTHWESGDIKATGVSKDMSEFIRSTIIGYGGLSFVNVIATSIDFDRTTVLYREKRCSDFYRSIDEFEI
jgi:hypothetical protein